MPSAQFMLWLYFFILLATCCHIGATNGKSYFLFGKKQALPCQIVVDQSGHGNFSTVQSAIDHIPSNNKNWVSICIKAGIYREKVQIGGDKPFIVLRGEGKRNTQVIWDDHESPAQSPTFTTYADNIVAKSLSFVNSYNIGNSRPTTPAVAALVAGDKTAFYQCGFASVQDTLWDDGGRHYYRECSIEGAVDFIFGGGQSIYEDCLISMLGSAIQPGFIGYITAQGRANPNETNGFVFKGGVVLGTGSTFLGRPWRDYARVLFYSVNLSSVITPKGWDAWNRSENLLTFAEQGCYGEGADTSQRVSWEKKLSGPEVSELTSISFIDREGWLQKQPS